MAQIEPTDKGKKKKGAQKKMAIHVDFTPMVDMNMLLITFFMLCTTMLKSQTLQIVLPSNDQRIKEDQKNQAKAEDAITLILDTEYGTDGKPLHDKDGNTVHNIYYYEGMPDTVAANIDGQKLTSKGAIRIEHFIDGAGDNRQGIRKVLYNRHKEAMDKYLDLKKKYRDKQITKAEFDEQAKQNATDENLKHPVVIIKPGPNTTYEALVYAIDELNLNQIRKYSIQMPDSKDTVLLKNYARANGKEVIRPNVRKATK